MNHSDNIPQSDYWTGSDNLALGVPWLVPEATAFIGTILDSSSRVLEFGAGGSTIYFSRRCHFVDSIENNPLWYRNVQDRLSVEHLFNVSLQLYTDDARFKHWMDTLDTESYDLTLIDGGVPMDRADVCSIALPKIKTGGWLVLDNYSRYKLAFNVSSAIRFDDPHWHGSGTLLLKLERPV